MDLKPKRTQKNQGQKLPTNAIQMHNQILQEQQIQIA
jgi:hypothetical protein